MEQKKNKEKEVEEMKSRLCSVINWELNEMTDESYDFYANIYII